MGAGGRVPGSAGVLAGRAGEEEAGGTPALPGKKNPAGILQDDRQSGPERGARPDEAHGTWLGGAVRRKSSASRARFPPPGRLLTPPAPPGTSSGASGTLPDAPKVLPAVLEAFRALRKSFRMLQKSFRSFRKRFGRSRNRSGCSGNGSGRAKSLSGGSGSVLDAPKVVSEAPEAFWKVPEGFWKLRKRFRRLGKRFGKSQSEPARSRKEVPGAWRRGGQSASTRRPTAPPGPTPPGRAARRSRARGAPGRRPAEARRERRGCGTSRPYGRGRGGRFRKRVAPARSWIHPAQLIARRFISGRRSAPSLPSPLWGFLFFDLPYLGLAPQATDLRPFGAAPAARSAGRRRSSRPGRRAASSRRRGCSGSGCGSFQRRPSPSSRGRRA